MNERHNAKLLQLINLRTTFTSKRGQTVAAVDGVDLTVKPGEVHGLVGESGCGKTVTSFSILSLVGPPGRISDGQILWQGKDLRLLPEKRMRKIRGQEIAMIFQHPQASLNPLFSIGDQMVSVIRLHRKLSKKEARSEALKLLGMVKISNPEKCLDDYPYQLSGGMCQRVMIAMALSCRPQLLIADEPTSALDVTIQAQILDLLLEIREEFHMAILLISHDMGVVARMCDRISVMYLGRIVEVATAEKLYNDPRHPYTRVLLDSVPVPDPKAGRKSNVRGDLPTMTDRTSGCRFRDRCAHAFEKCSSMEPELKKIDGNTTKAACWLYQ